MTTMLDPDNHSQRKSFFESLPDKYSANEDGMMCDDGVEKHRQLKRLKQALQDNVLSKLRSCRDDTLTLELRWFRNCRWEQKYEDKDLYLCPKYNQKCGSKRLNGYLTANDEYEPDFAQTGDQSATDIQALLQTAINDNPAFTDSSPTTEQKITNFFLHHSRVRDRLVKHSKVMRCDAALAELRHLDFSFMLPDCVTASVLDTDLVDVHGHARTYEALQSLLLPVATDTAAEMGAALVAKFKYAGTSPSATAVAALIAAQKTVTDAAAGNTAPTAKQTQALADAKNGILPLFAFKSTGCGGTQPFIRADQTCYTGLMNNEPFMQSLTGSQAIARAARALTAGCHKNCPAAKGHLPEAYPLMTCAPGSSGTYWVNVVRAHKYFDGDSDDGKTITKCEWVPAHDLMVAKLATCDEMTKMRAEYVKKEYLCLKQKQNIADKPPCADTTTMNTGMHINQLRNITQSLKAKGLSKEACMSLMLQNLGEDGGGGGGKRRSRRSQSRRTSRRKSRSRR